MVVMWYCSVGGAAVVKCGRRKLMKRTNECDLNSFIMSRKSL